MEGDWSRVQIDMFPSLIDQPTINHHLTSNSWHQCRIIQSAITTTIAAASLLDMNDTGARHKNAQWDEDAKVFQMMAFLSRIWAMPSPL